MGKLLTRLAEESQPAHTRIEGALHDAGFRRTGGCFWNRSFLSPGSRATSVTFNMALRQLFVERDERPGICGIPDGLLENDDADGLLAWMDRELEQWL